MTRPAIAYLNGAFMAPGEASISPLDRGFLFGDAVYEVIPVYGGHPFRVEQHLERLAASLAAVRIPEPLSRDDWLGMIEGLIARAPDPELSVYIQVSRGDAGHRDHAFPEDCAPTVFATATPVSPGDRAVPQGGVAAITCRDIRWQRCDIKATTLLANILLRQQALDAGASEALLHDGETVTEGAASNVFVVHGSRVATPPKTSAILPGITRDWICELVRDDGIELSERPVTVDELGAADEVWITSSTRELLPVTRVDDAPVGTGLPGPIWQHVYGLLEADKSRWLAERERSGNATERTAP